MLCVWLVMRCVLIVDGLVLSVVSTALWVICVCGLLCAMGRLVVYCLSFVLCCLLRVVRCVLFAVWRLSVVVSCVLFVGCCFLALSMVRVVLLVLVSVVFGAWYAVSLLVVGTLCCLSSDVFVYCRVFLCVVVRRLSLSVDCRCLQWFVIVLFVFALGCEVVLLCVGVYSCLLLRVVVRVCSCLVRCCFVRVRYLLGCCVWCCGA